MRGVMVMALPVLGLMIGCGRSNDLAPVSINGRTEVVDISVGTGPLVSYRDSSIVTTYSHKTYETLNPDGTLLGSGTYTYKKTGANTAQADYHQTAGKWAGVTWHDELKFDGAMQGSMTADQVSGGTAHFAGRFRFE